MLMQLFPGQLLTPALLTPDVLDGFIPRIKRLCSTPVLDAGMTLTLASLTDFIFLEKGDPERWEKNEELLGLLEQTQSALVDPQTDTSEELAEWIEGNKLRYPLRARQWIKARSTWEPLRQGPLSPSTLHRSLRDGPLLGPQGAPST